MPHEDFDIDSLAVYLHLTPPQVAKMADRGKLPGRKVGGHWRFSPAEIHHWLEDRIGVSAEDELIEVVGVLQRAARDTENQDVSITSMLSGCWLPVFLSCSCRAALCCLKTVARARATGMPELSGFYFSRPIAKSEFVDLFSSAQAPEHAAKIRTPEVA